MKGSGSKALGFNFAKYIDFAIGVADNRRHSRAIVGKDSDLTDQGAGTDDFSDFLDLHVTLH